MSLNPSLLAQKWFLGPRRKIRKDRKLCGSNTVYIYIYRLYIYIYIFIMHIYIYICMYVCMYVCIYVYVHYKYIYICVCVCFMYINININIYIYLYLFTFTNFDILILAPDLLMSHNFQLQGVIVLTPINPSLSAWFTIKSQCPCNRIKYDFKFSCMFLQIENLTYKYGSTNFKWNCNSFT